MSSDRGISAPRALALIAVGGVTLGIAAQLLRQIQGPPMALGGATAPWLTIGFLCAIWTTRRGERGGEANFLGIATVVVYLGSWLAAYHVTFAVRESVGQAAAWREAAPWLVLAGPASVVLGLAAATVHRRGAIADAALALPIAWSMPEILSAVRDGWSYAVVVAVPTVALALTPLILVRRRGVNFVLFAVVFVLFAAGGWRSCPSCAASSIREDAAALTLRAGHPTCIPTTGHERRDRNEEADHRKRPRRHR